MYWVGESIPKPLSAMAFAAPSVPARKVVADLAVTDELIKSGSIDVLALLERGVVSAVAGAIDSGLIDPTNAGVKGVKPPSLTNGLTPITPAGDFSNNIGQVHGAPSGGAPTNPVMVVSGQTAARLTGLRGLTAAGVKVLVSPAAGARIIGIDADGIVYSDDGGDLVVGEPTIEMNDAPTHPATSSTVFVSAWQRGLKVVRGERAVNWAKRDDAVAFLNWRKGEHEYTGVRRRQLDRVPLKVWRPARARQHGRPVVRCDDRAARG